MVLICATNRNQLFWVTYSINRFSFYFKACISHLSHTDWFQINSQAGNRSQVHYTGNFFSPQVPKGYKSVGGSRIQIQNAVSEDTREACWFRVIQKVSPSAFRAWLHGVFTQCHLFSSFNICNWNTFFLAILCCICLYKP